MIKVGKINDALSHISELATATHLHIEWIKNFHKALVFQGRLERFPELAAAQGRALGQWYAGQSHPAITASPLYADVGTTLQKVRASAEAMLSAVADGESIDDKVYDLFMLHMVHLSDQLRQLEGEIWGEITSRDALTGMYNRTALEAFLDRPPRTAAGKVRGAVALVDIDLFKTVNDSHGHQAGDDAIRSVAQTILVNLRNYDLAYRYGGEEFLIYLDAIALDDARNVCERIRANVESLHVPLPGGTSLRVTISIGLARLGDGEAVKDAVALADQALYASKAGGRNRVTVADPHALSILSEESLS